MPYAIVFHAFPRTDLPLAHTQGKILHGVSYELKKPVSPKAMRSIVSRD